MIPKRKSRPRRFPARAILITLPHMRILGVDPGLSTMGLGLIEAHPDGRMEALDWAAITTEPSLPLPDRLVELAEDLEKFLDEAEPTLAVVERLFFETNVKTAMDVSQARGVALVTLRKRGIDVIEVAPLALKMSITGDGKADKTQVQMMVKRLLKLKTMPTPADAADALALALHGAFQRKLVQLAVTVPPITSHVRRPVR